MAVDGDVRSSRHQRRLSWWFILSSQKKCLVLVIILLLLTMIGLIIFLLVRGTREEALPICLTRDCIESAEILRDSVDLTVDPCQNFYKFACGNFLKQYNTVPDPEFPFWNPTVMLSVAARTAVKNILESGKKEGQLEAVSKLKLAYTSCIKSLTTDEGSFQRLSEAMRREGFVNWPQALDHWKNDYFDLEDIMSSLWVNDIRPFIDYFFTENMKETYYLYWLHNGKSQKFFNDSEAVKKYAALMENIFSQFNISNSAELVKDIIDFEKDLNMIRSNVSSEILFLELSLEEMDENYHGMNMTRLFTLIIQKSGSLKDPGNLTVITFFELTEMLELLLKTPSKTLYGYFAWHFIYEMSLYASPTLRVSRQLFEVDVRRGAKQKRFKPTWQVCLSTVYPHFKEALTAEFARVMFSQDRYDEIRGYLKYLKDSFLRDLPKQTWLDHATIEMTKEKLSNLSIVIGYPPSLMEPKELNKIYEKLDMKSDDFLFNLLQLRKIKVKEVVDRLGTNQSESRWNYNPMDINAFNNIYKNTIVLPISILYPPFFQLHRPKYLNYGGIGFVIGHEMGHSFDNKGIETDLNKDNSLGWWDESMQKVFHQRAQCYVDQYSNYTFLDITPPGKLNGSLTLSENIADHIGLKHSFQAYKEFERIHGSEVGLPGLNFTNYQLFFLQYAQFRCTTYGPVGAKLFYQDVHTPNEFRIHGTLVNSRDFAEVFKCPQGTPMNPEPKCKLWI